MLLPLELVPLELLVKFLLVLMLMTVLVWASGQVLNTPVIVVYRFGLYALSFLTGYFIFSHEEVIGRLKRVCVPVIMAAAVLGTAFCIVYFGRNTHSFGCSDTFQRLPCCRRRTDGGRGRRRACPRGSFIFSVSQRRLPVLTH